MIFTLTKFEKSWLQIFAILGVIVFIFFLVQPILPGSTTHEPLADAKTLRELIKGNSIPVPPNEKTAQFHGRYMVPMQLANLTNSERPILGTNSEDKRIEVDLTHQKVYAYEGNTKVFDFLVSTGKWAPTPTGEFRIWVKVRSQKMEGGRKEWGTYYYLPNVPYVMFFSNNEFEKMRGFSFHGTYWHNNFGHPMSHGCVNMKTADAETLYNWANPPVTNPKAWSTLADATNPGTRVVIYGEAPAE